MKILNECWRNFAGNLCEAFDAMISLESCPPVAISGCQDKLHKEAFISIFNLATRCSQSHGFVTLGCSVYTADGD